MKEEWLNFKEGLWTTEINVSDFIKKNYKAYEGDESFLEGATEKNQKSMGNLYRIIKRRIKEKSIRH